MGIDNLFGSLATVPIPQYTAPLVCVLKCVCAQMVDDHSDHSPLHHDIICY